MNDILHRPLTGGLFGWRNIASLRKSLSSIEITDEAAGAAGWRLLRYQTRDPLVEGNNDNPVGQPGQLDYYFLLRISGVHAVLAGAESRVVEAFIQRLQLNMGMFTPRVYVDRLVENLSSSTDGRFLMGAIFARVEGYGNSLRSISLFGHDIADAELFQLVRKDLSPYRVELRDVTSGIQLLSISSRGEINFHYDGIDALTNVTATLKALADESYIEWPL